MPLIRWWTRRSLVWQLTVLCSILLAVCAALAVSVIALSSSRNATHEAKGTALRAAAIAKCVNNILGDRSDVQSRDAIAHEQWAESLNKVLLAPKGPAQDAAFVAFEHATALYVQTLEADQAYRTHHPLGRC